METITRLSTQEVEQFLFGIPENHKHCRLIIKTDQNQTFIFSEALVAAIVRSYILVKTHPIRSSIEMAQKIIEKPKDDFATYQLLETNTDDMHIHHELSKYID
jgi:hypothetical protein